MSEIKIIEQRIKEFEKSLETLNPSDEKYSKELNRINIMKKNLAFLKHKEREKKPDQQIPPKISKKKKPTKKDKRDEKLKKALEAGAKVGERSISKLSWDMAHNKVKVVSGKLDYRSWQILDCVADKIAQNEWMPALFNLPCISSNADINNERRMVVISAKEFKDHIRNQNISNKNLTKMFEDLPEAILKGEVHIPFYYPKYQWVTIDFYKDNICGLAIAHEDKEFEKFRSKRKLRSNCSGGEEPVFILIFSNPFGQTFFEHSRKREACQLINQELYKIDPNAQELFQSVRWNEGLIIVTPKFISRAVGWTWPPGDMDDRVKRCRRLLDILYKGKFINKIVPQGGSVKKRSWLFYISKARGTKKKEIVIKNGQGSY